MRRAVRGVGSGFEYDRAPCGKGRTHLARGHRRGEVPRRDQHGYSDRLVHHQDPVVAAGGCEHGTERTHGLFGIPAEELRCVGGLAACVRKRLAVLQDDESGDLLTAFRHDLEGTTQDLSAVPRRHCSPRRQCIAGSCHRRDAVVDRCGSDGGDHVAGCRIFHIERVSVGGGTPDTADEAVRRHRRTELVEISHRSAVLLIDAVVRATDASASSSGSSAAGRGMAAASVIGVRATSPSIEIAVHRLPTVSRGSRVSQRYRHLTGAHRIRASRSAGQGNRS
jgi:hypothetical protein